MLRGLLYGFLVLVLTGVGLELAEPQITAYLNRSVTAEKVGLVVDSTTGQGIEGVTVILDLTEEGGGVTGSFGKCLKQQIAKTDSSGLFTFPGVAGEIEFPRVWWKQLIARVVNMSGPYIEYSWHIVPYKPGLLRSGDETLVKNAAAAERQQDRSFPWYWNPPPATIADGIVHIDSIGMHPVLLQPPDAVIYTFSLYARGSCGAERNLDDFKSLQTTMGKIAAAGICELPRDYEVRPNVVRALATLSGDQHFLSAMHSSSGSDLWELKPHSAGQLCDSLNQ